MRSVFEIKLVCLEGEFPGLTDRARYSPACVRAVDTIMAAPIAKLYSFLVDDTAKRELREVAAEAMRRAFGSHAFKSLPVLEAMGVRD